MKHYAVQGMLVSNDSVMCLQPRPRQLRPGSNHTTAGGPLGALEWGDFRRSTMSINPTLAFL